MMQRTQKAAHRVFGCFLRIGVDEGMPSTDDVIPVPPPEECLLDPETGLPSRLQRPTV